MHTKNKSNVKTQPQKLDKPGIYITWPNCARPNLDVVFLYLQNFRSGGTKLEKLKWFTRPKNIGFFQKSHCWGWVLTLGLLFFVYSRSHWELPEVMESCYRPLHRASRFYWRFSRSHWKLKPLHKAPRSHGKLLNSWPIHVVTDLGKREILTFM